MNRLLLGVMYGFAAGMFARGLLDYFEAVAHSAKHPVVQPRVVTRLEGAQIVESIRKHKRRGGSL